MSELIKRQDAIDAVSRQYRYESDRMTALQNVAVVTEHEIRAKAIEEFTEQAMKRFTELELKDSLATVTYCKIILRDVAEQLKGGAV